MEIPDKLHYGSLAFCGSDRNTRTKELEIIINDSLNKSGSLNEYQDTLYATIETLEKYGFFLGPFDYDSEKEYWGGQSYMWTPPYTEEQLKKLEIELHLISRYPKGVELFWGNDETHDY